MTEKYKTNSISRTCTAFRTPLCDKVIKKHANSWVGRSNTGDTLLHANTTCKSNVNYNTYFCFVLSSRTWSTSSSASWWNTSWISAKIVQSQSIKQLCYPTAQTSMNYYYPHLWDDNCFQSCLCVSVCSECDFKMSRVTKFIFLICR